ncbi:MAG: ATP-grasp domain-containing protein [Termitinemataceae bacterium]|nr:MAG: ATP-grasp domain-containing protein [Termitinemataceae bacterium]
MKERIMILGAGTMQGPAIKISKEMGLEVIVVDGNQSAEFAKAGERFLNIDLKDKEAIAEAAKQIKGESGLSGIFTAGTDFSATVAYACEKTGLPGIPYEAALRASDKALMRACFEKAEVRSPRFTVVTVADFEGTKKLTIADFPGINFLSAPLVIKPVDNMGGRGCRKVANKTELDDAIKEAAIFSASGRVIVEEFMEGPEYSIDAIVFDGKITICGIAERHIFFPPYFIEMGHTMPAVLSEADRRELVTMFEKGVRALGITMGAAKGDVKLTKKGAAIGEIAARLSGGYMSGWTYPYSSGVQVTKAAILIALGRPPKDTKPLFSKTSAERAFISIPGIIHAIKNAENAENVEQVENIFLRVAQGSPVDFPQNNVSKCGNVITCSASGDQAIEAAERVVKSILFELECPNVATEEFLASYGQADPKFPPDAFAVDAHVKAAADMLPPTRFAEGDDFALAEFAAFEKSASCDLVGRTVEESLQAVRLLCALELPKCSANEAPKNVTVLGREFWQAMIRGGYQGASYYLKWNILNAKKF